MDFIRDIFSQKRFGDSYEGEIENRVEVIDGKLYVLFNCKYDFDTHLFYKINPSKISKINFHAMNQWTEFLEEKTLDDGSLLFTKPSQKSIPNQSLGLDVSDDPKEVDFTLWKEKKGVKFVIVRTSVCRENDYYYGSDNARKQISNAISLGLTPLPYHHSYFGDNVEKAIKEAEYAVKKAKNYGLEKGFLALDYEWTQNKDKNANTDAVIAWMKRVEELGFSPVIYLGIHFLRTKVDINRITNLYGKCLWFASYKSEGKLEAPDLEYLKSLHVDNILIWQFTRHYYVEGQEESITMDGNILLDDLLLKEIEK